MKTDRYLTNAFGCLLLIVVFLIVLSIIMATKVSAQESYPGPGTIPASGSATEDPYPGPETGEPSATLSPSPVSVKKSPAPTKIENPPPSVIEIESAGSRVYIDQVTIAAGCVILAIMLLFFYNKKRGEM